MTDYGEHTTPDQWRAAVAEKVCGWRVEDRLRCSHHGRWTEKTWVGHDGEPVMRVRDFAPDENAEHDRIVLEHVRERWDAAHRRQAELALDDIRNARHDPTLTPSWNYERGDWSAAALAVVEGESDG